MHQRRFRLILVTLSVLKSLATLRMNTKRMLDQFPKLAALTSAVKEPKFSLLWSTHSAQPLARDRIVILDSSFNPPTVAHADLCTAACRTSKSASHSILLLSVATCVSSVQGLMLRLRKVVHEERRQGCCREAISRAEASNDASHGSCAHRASGHRD